jgi:hypothetical protein
MPCNFLCDFGRAALFRFGFAIFLAVAAASPARSQQEREGAATEQKPPVNPIDRWNRMSPEERERELAKLPPERAKLIRQRIWRYNQMHPEEKQALRRRYQTFSQLPPEERQIVRDRFRELRQLAPARQTIVHREVEHVRQLPEAQRRALMDTPEFRSKFSPPERQIIRDLSTFLPN